MGKNQIEDIFEDYFTKTESGGADMSVPSALLNFNLFERVEAIKSCAEKTKEVLESLRAEEKIFFEKSASFAGELNEAQLKETRDFWKPYSFAYKNNTETQRYFSSVSGVFDPSYITPALHRQLVKRFFGAYKADFVCDKSNFPVIFPEVATPPILFRRTDWEYRDDKNKIISREEAIKIFLNASASGKALMLRSLGAEDGDSTLTFQKPLTRGEILKEISNFGEKNFICDEFAKPHESWRFAPSVSFAAAKIMTFIYDGRAEIVSARLELSTECDGTMSRLSVEINDDGTLAEKILDLSKTEWRETLPCGTPLAGKRLYSYQKIIETVLAMALKAPELKSLTWKIYADEAGGPLLFSLSPYDGLEECQLHGRHPYCGKEKMKALLDKYLINSFYYERASWEWDFWEFKSFVTLCGYRGGEKSIMVPEELNGKPVSVIRSRAFAGRGIKRIVIPPTVKITADDAFAGCAPGCEITMMSRLALYKKIYRVIKKLPFCRTTAIFLKECWMETMVKKTSSPFQYLVKRIKKACQS
ncbi:MAG: hypothetical protein SOR75_05870 [Synergistes jonesii]|nr:hypothetical protein [Synergistes jonesii]